MTQRPPDNPSPASPSANSVLPVVPDVGVGAVKLTRDEWAVVRCLMGRPRRLSHRFLNAERERLTHQRHRLRKLQLDLINNTQTDNDNSFDAPVPDDIPPPMVVGQRVVARYTVSTPHIPPSTYASFQPGELAPGTIIAVDLPNCRYRVKFDTWETDIGWVDDTDLMSVGPLDLVPWRPLSPPKPSSPTAPVALAPLLPCPATFVSGVRTSGASSSSSIAHDDRGPRSWPDRGTTCVYPAARSQSSTHHPQNIPHQPQHQCKPGFCFADSMDADQVLNALLADLRAASAQMTEAAKSHGQCDYMDDADPVLMLAITNTLKLKKSMVDCLKSMNETAQDTLNNQSLPQPYTWNAAYRHRYMWLVERIAVIDRVFPSNILKIRGAGGVANGTNVVSGSETMAVKDPLPQRYRSITTGLDLLSELSMEMRSVEDSDDRNNVGTPISDCADGKSANGKVAKGKITNGSDSVFTTGDANIRSNRSPALKVTRARVKELIDKCVALLVRIRETGSSSSDGTSRANAEELAKALKAMLPPSYTRQSGDPENVTQSEEERGNAITNLKDNLSMYKEIELLVQRMHPRLSEVPTPDGIR